MHLNRLVKIQLAIFTIIAVGAAAIMVFGYMRLPSLWFGVGRYTVTAHLPQAAGLYDNANVTYRGTEVGRVQSVTLTDTGAVDAVLSLRSDIAVPSDLTAEVHSVSGVGEQYVALLPHGEAPPLKNGDVIPASATRVPPDINSLLEATNRGLQAIPPDNLKTVVDESAIAVGGLGPELSRIVRGSTQLAIDARANLDSLTTLIDKSPPILDSQADSAGSIRSWAGHLASLTHQLQQQDDAVSGIIQHAGPAFDEGRHLFERLQPTLPLLLANLAAAAPVAVTYQPAIEQLLVLFPAGVANMQGTSVANQNMPPKYRGAYLDFKLNINVPPPCVTGYLPPQQARTPNFTDVPDRPAGDLYCRIPQDAPINGVRGARNLPCLTRPGKRAPMVKMCESDEQYVPLNDGNNWKGDPNATLSGQDIPHLPPGAAPTPPPAAEAPPTPPSVATAEYDPATGYYVGPDGRVYRQS
ncbi:MAG: MCE family protein, partial [Mycobacterium sp.]